MSEDKNSLPALPEGWVWTTVGELMEPSREKVNPLKIEEMPYISLEHIDKDTGRLLGYGVSSEIRSTKTRFYSGDLLYGKLRPYLNKVHLANFEGVCSTDILVFPRKDYISNSFLLYRFLCRDFVNYASQNVSGVNLPRVDFRVLSQFKISLPPLQEQHRIVAKIEGFFTKLDAGVAALKRTQTQLKQYRQSVLKAAVEGELTKGWRKAHQDELDPASALLERILKERREKWAAEQLAQMEAKGNPPKDDKWKAKYKEPATPNASDLLELAEGWVWANMEGIGEVSGGLTKNSKRAKYPQKNAISSSCQCIRWRIAIGGSKRYWS
ncbi:restriction endonuclease subunit S [Candidatus Poribacteria bacterium]|nr:restriction endonuclease subunit S [Candidatus Poribacteria bacterium]